MAGGEKLSESAVVLVFPYRDGTKTKCAIGGGGAMRKTKLLILLLFIILDEAPKSNQKHDFFENLCQMTLSTVSLLLCAFD